MREIIDLRAAKRMPSREFIAHSLGNYAVYDALAYGTPEDETVYLFKYFHNLWGEFPAASMFKVNKQITTLAEIQGYNSVYGDYPRLNIENLLGSV